MKYNPENLNKWTTPVSYAGAEWFDYYSSGVGRSRDSDALERSNFECMLTELGGTSDTIITVNEGHWAVGWVEWIAIHEIDTKALETADKVVAALADYPVIDDDHYSETEQEDAQETWSNCYDDKERLEYIKKYRDQFEFHNYKDLIQCVRGQHFCGYANELLY